MSHTSDTLGLSSCHMLDILCGVSPSMRKCWGTFSCTSTFLEKYGQRLDKFSNSCRKLLEHRLLEHRRARSTIAIDARSKPRYIRDLLRAALDLLLDLLLDRLDCWRISTFVKFLSIFFETFLDGSTFCQVFR